MHEHGGTTSTRTLPEAEAAIAAADRAHLRRVEHCIDVAVEFIASQEGGALRLLNAHYERDGMCAECIAAPVTWPCTTASLALRALRHKGVKS